LAGAEVYREVPRSKLLLGETESLEGGPERMQKIQLKNRIGWWTPDLKATCIKDGKEFVLLRCRRKVRHKEDIPLWIEEGTREIVIPYSHDGNLKNGWKLKA
jgi:hypothetical protein